MTISEIEQMAAAIRKRYAEAFALELFGDLTEAFAARDRLLMELAGRDLHQLAEIVAHVRDHLPPDAVKELLVGKDRTATVDELANCHPGGLAHGLLRLLHQQARRDARQLFEKTRGWAEA